MNKILVPIDNFSSLSLSAAYFAVEFAKRNPTKVLFLFFSSFRERDEADPGNKIKPLPKPFDELMQKARAEKINLDLFFSSEGYLDTLPRFARDHHISEIILAVPATDDPLYLSVKQQIDELRSRIDSQMVIVRPKEEKPLTTSGKLEGKDPLPST
ncbi:MAG: universal stress protein [Thermodesulfobacteriota bacterium]